MNHLLETDSVQLQFGLRKILSDIYLKVKTGHITGLLGRNGTGKTCLMNIIYGSLRASDSSVRIDGKAIFQTYRHPDILLYLPQFNFIPARLKVIQVFRDFQLAYDLFEAQFPEFKNKRNHRIKEISGGQQRLLEVYVTLCAPSQFVLMDEPFSHIMPIEVEKIKVILQKEKKHKGVLITDHMYRHITDISDQLYVLTGGKTQLAKTDDDLTRLGYVLGH